MVDLYHYNTKKLNKIYTPKKQFELGIISKDDLDNKKQYGDDYINHISLFLDPIPLDLIRKHFTSNKTYQSNEFIFEHVIHCEQLKDNLYMFNLKENPINNFMSEYLWVDSDLVKPIYFNIRKILNKLVGYDGKDYSDLIKIINKFKGKTKQAFIDLINSDKFSDELKKMYAPTVPHLFIYPINGELEVKEVKKKYFKD
jgi:hypothetical protein